MTYTVYLPFAQSNTIPDINRQVLAEINSFRQLHGVGPLTPHDGLMVSAQLAAQDARDRGGPLRHVPNWTQHIVLHYPEWHAIAELLAVACVTAARLAEVWYWSDSHRAAMVSALYQDVGVGHAQDGSEYGHWWCVHLGSTQ